MVEPVIIERLTRVAPLGLRFWDAVSNAFVTDGLLVQAVPKPATGVYGGAPATAIPNHSGVFVFIHLPGLQTAEIGLGDKDYWTTPPAQLDFLVTVTDALDRYFPFTLTVKAPTQKILDFSCASGKPTPLLTTQPENCVPLYHKPGRAAPAGFGAIHATLARNSSDPQPAALAMVEAYIDTNLVARGFTDASGSVSLYFPYPKIVLPNPLANRPPLTKQTWPVDLIVFSALSPPPGDPPDLCDLVGQPAASPLQQVSPNQPLQTLDLLFGQELVVQTNDKSELFLS